VPPSRLTTAEHRRLDDTTTGAVSAWRKWGCYVGERAWGTVREDYSAEGDAWNYLTHDHARSKAYRWGEDGIAGLCDRYQTLIFSPALWNGRDPILKERMFGLTPGEGNHGEDVKEYYFYLDATPTGSYMKLLYKYPQSEYPYERLIDESRRRSGTGPEFELLDTGSFDGDRYFDVVIEYAKADPEDLCIKVEVFNRGRDDADFHFVPQLWFRNTWAWGPERGRQPEIRRGLNNPRWQELIADDSARDPLLNLMSDYRLGTRHLYAPPGAVALFTDNETNAERVYGPGTTSAGPYTKEAFHRAIVNGEQAAVNPAGTGTKACLHYRASVPGRGSTSWHMRLARAVEDPLRDVEQIVLQRRAEADEFYAAIHPPRASADEKLVQRQALAGMLWSKQFYFFDVNVWFDGDNPAAPPPASRRNIRNRSWRHLNSMRILSMPDKWEYPWFAAWDLAFHSVALALVDPKFAKDNLWLLLFEQFQHPNGQIPAYEWEFSDLNPPVHAWACWRVYSHEKERTGKGDTAFLEKCFQKLLMNFTWWVNKVDSQGLNVFEGGFLGLDNITVVDRSQPLPPGALLEQSDATGWMGFFCLQMMRIAIELSHTNPVYEAMATKFFEHFTYIGGAMKKMGGRGYELWDDDDGFFYDVLRYGDGSFQKFRVRSLVGLVPLFAVEVLDPGKIEHLEVFLADVDWFVRNRPDLIGMACYHGERNGQKFEVLSIVDQQQLTRILQHIWNDDEFLSPGGIRSLSRCHRDHPFTFGTGTVRYEPAEADSKIKGGNSNWRGPVWFPTSYLLIEALAKFAAAHGPGFKVDAPAAHGTPLGPGEMARNLADRMIGLFTRGQDGTRRIFGTAARFQQDPYWRDCLLFHEYFHGENGAGLGANHQTGWTGLIANLIDEWRR
jgi:hypothetical protein